MGESKLNINSQFKVPVRTANAIFSGGGVCKYMQGAIYRQRVVCKLLPSAAAFRGVLLSNSSSSGLLFLIPARKKTEKERVLVLLPCACLSVCVLTCLSFFSLTITP